MKTSETIVTYTCDVCEAKMERQWTPTEGRPRKVMIAEDGYYQKRFVYEDVCYECEAKIRKFLDSIKKEKR